MNMTNSLKLRSAHRAIKLLLMIAITANMSFTTAVAQTITGVVTAIKDGDTIELLIDKKPNKIRLYGIDCPEKSQDYGTQATKFTAEKCFQKKVTIRQFGKDKYGRTLGVVILADGSNLNQLLVTNGFAWRYKYSTDKELLKMQHTAMAQKLGLWSMPEPTPPWNFRKDHRRKKK